MTLFLSGAIGFFVLIASANFFVDGAVGLAKRLRVSDLVIGLTVVAFGTSMPELFVNLFASFNGNSQLALGNIYGSNIFNILIILGISALIFPLKVARTTVWKEIPFSFLAAIMALILTNDIFIECSNGSALTRIDGFVLLSFFIIFLYYLHDITRQDADTGEVTRQAQNTLIKIALTITFGLIGLIVGGRLVVSSAVTLAHTFGISESVIGLTIVAIGTSLPELATSVVAATKKNADIAVGNIVGSNIFNVFFILGISSTINPISLSGWNNIDGAVLLLASALLFVSMFSGKRHVIDRWEGLLFIFLYVGYIIFLLLRV